MSSETTEKKRTLRDRGAILTQVSYERRFGLETGNGYDYEVLKVNYTIDEFSEIEDSSEVFLEAKRQVVQSSTPYLKKKAQEKKDGR